MTHAGRARSPLRAFNRTSGTTSSAWGVARTDVTKESEGIPPIAQPKVAKNDLGTGRHDFHSPEKGCDPPGLRNALSSTASMLDENPPAPVLDPPLRPEAGIS